MEIANIALKLSSLYYLCRQQFYFFIKNESDLVSQRYRTLSPSSNLISFDF